MYSAGEIAGIIWDSQASQVELYTLAQEDVEFAGYIDNYYGLDGELLADGAVLFAGGADASEIAVLCLKDPGDVQEVMESLRAYINIRMGDFVGYMPEQVRLLENAAVSAGGTTIALMVCGDPREAQRAFAGCFDGEADALPVVSSAEAVSREGVQTAQEKHIYDREAVLDAWRTGDTSLLSDKDKAILAAAEQAIAEEVTDGMTEYQRELAVHDWMLGWTDYDGESLSHMPDAQPDPDNDNPYGLLIGRRAICTGYAETFQLLMDLLDIECITVHGWAHNGQNEHAWNMVRLDGEWYCVDPTWDDAPAEDDYNEFNQHRFFNITSQAMRDSDHQWDEAAVPEAEGTVYCWSEGDLEIE